MDRVAFERTSPSHEATRPKAVGEGPAPRIIQAVVISDTHFPQRGRMLPEQVAKAMRQADLVIHAGDFCSLEAVEHIGSFAPLKAVHGNVDQWEVKQKLPGKLVFKMGNRKVGLIHGDGSSGTARDRALKAFTGEKVDCIIFGHTHMPYSAEEGGVLLLNPGSPTAKRGAQHYSFAVLVEDMVTGRFTARLVYF